MNGLVHRAGDAEEVAAHLATLRMDAPAAAAMGRAARATAEAWPVERGVAILREAMGLPARRLGGPVP